MKVERWWILMPAECGRGRLGGLFRGLASWLECDLMLVVSEDVHVFAIRMSYIFHVGTCLP